MEVVVLGTRSTRRVRNSWRDTAVVALSVSLVFTTLVLWSIGILDTVRIHLEVRIAREVTLSNGSTISSIALGRNLRVRARVVSGFRSVLGTDTVDV